MAKDKKQSEEVVEVEAEEMPVSVVLQESINQEVKRFDPYEARMNELREKYSGLKIASPSDKEGIEQNRLAIADLRTIRVNTEKERKQIKAPFLKAAADIEAKAQWIISEVGKIEEPLKAQKKEIQEEMERIAAEEKERILKRNKIRTAQLSDMGAVFNGVDYVLGDVAYSFDIISSTDADIYDEKILPKYREVFEKNELARLEQDRLKKEQEAKEQADREKFEAEQKAFREQQEQLKKDQDKRDEEKKKYLEDLQNRRINELSRYHQYLSGYDVSELWKLSHTEYDQLLEKVKADYKNDEEARKRAEEADKERKEAQSKRIAQLYELGLKFDLTGGYFVNFDVFIHQIDVQNYSDERWDEMIKATTVHIFAFKEKEAEKEKTRIEKEKQDAIQKALDEQKEKERLAEIDRIAKLEVSADKAKYAETINYLKATPVYEMRSGQYRAKMRIINDFLADLK